MKRLLLLALLLAGCSDPEVESLQAQLADTQAQYERIKEDLKQIPALDAEVRKLESERDSLLKEWRRLRP